MADERLLYMEAVVHWPLEVRINDVPVGRYAAGETEFRAFEPVPGYVKQGENRLAVRLDRPFVPPPPPPPPPPGEAPEPEKVWVRLRVAEFNDGDEAFAGDGRQLGELVWSPPAPGLVHETTFASSQGPNDWSWSRCEPLRLDPDTVRSALTFVEAMAEAYRALDPGPILAASGPKIAELGPAFRFAPGELEGKISDAIRLDGPVRPAPASPFDPRLCGDGRLLECVGRDGKPYVRGIDAEGNGDFLSMIIGRLEGRWQIFR